MQATLRIVRDYARMVRLSHSIFAMPFALASVLFASIEHSIGPATVAWILVAMVAARNAAMGFNRLVDAAIDARNPRTAGREIPRGALRPAAVAIFVVLLIALFVLAAGMLGPLCLALSPLALAIVLGYSYTKRLTSGSHLVLGLSLAIAPVGAWIAVTGTIAAAPIVLAAAVLFWVSGFDVIYALQDETFDRREGLRSIPARVGAARALVIARGLHVLAVAALAAIYTLVPLHPLYLAGVAAVGLLLVYEHRLVRADDLSRIDLAFFTTNGIISVLYLAVCAAGVYLRG